MRYAVAPPDAEHRFGHGKAEAFASLMQGAQGAIGAGGAQQQADPIATVMPALIKCGMDESCDPEAMVMGLPANVQQALMNAVEQFEESGGGPLAPYAAQAEAAGIDILDFI